MGQLHAEPWYLGEGLRVGGSTVANRGVAGAARCRPVRRSRGDLPNRDVRQLALPSWATDSVVLAPNHRIDPDALVRISDPALRRLRAALRRAAGAAITRGRMDDDAHSATRAAERSDTARSLTRAIDILEALAEEPMMLPQLAERVGLSTATSYRLARALADRGLLSTAGRSGFRLGPKIGELGASFERQQGGGRRD